MIVLPGEDLELPAGTNIRHLFEDAWHSAWRTEPEYRIWATRYNPVLFAYTYLFEQLSSEETDGRTSLAQHHIDMCRAAWFWAKSQPRRDWWVAPRGGAKSTWNFLILPIWALAHGHRSFFLGYGDNEREAQQHLSNLKEAVKENPLLLSDFPGLRSKRGAADNALTYTTAELGTFMVRGMDSKSLGVKSGHVRPNLIAFDDIEPVASEYSAALVRKRLSVIENKVLPMNEKAAVVASGTVTMWGSLSHDVVNAAQGVGEADWLREGGWMPHFYPAIVESAQGARRSYWEARHSLAWLLSREHTQDYRLNYAGKPTAPGQKMWKETTFIHLPAPVPIEGRIISLDVAVSGATTDDSLDYTAFAIAGRAVGRRGLAVVEYARAFHMTGRETLIKIHDICKANPDIREVIVETNQGHKLWEEILDPMPSGVKLTLYTSHLPKTHRIARLLDHYEWNRVVHASRLPEYEAQAVAYPDVEHDDLIDSVAAAVEKLLPAT